MPLTVCVEYRCIIQFLTYYDLLSGLLFWITQYVRRLYNVIRVTAQCDDIHFSLKGAPAVMGGAYRQTT